jgi:hypothetical protein
MDDKLHRMQPKGQHNDLGIKGTLAPRLCCKRHGVMAFLLIATAFPTVDHSDAQYDMDVTVRPAKELPHVEGTVTSSDPERLT